MDEDLFKSFSDVTLTSTDLLAQIYEVFLGSPNFPPSKNVLATKMHDLMLKLVQVIQVLATGMMKVEGFVPGLLLILLGLLFTCVR